MMTRRQHFVTFFSPGTFVSEETTKPIESWDVSAACRMAGDVVERYGAKPYAFRFHTSIVAEPVSDGEGGTMEVQPKHVARSGLHHLGGELLTVEDVKRRNEPDGRQDRLGRPTGKLDILIGNMEGNGMWYVVENTNSWRSTQPFEEGDVLVQPASGEVVARGDSAECKAYRLKKAGERKRQLDAERAEWEAKAATA